MKIWYQSGASFGANPEYSDYEATLKSHLNGIARPGTEVSVHGVKISSPYIETSRYEQLLHDHQVVENLIQAQREGYDAFCVGCTLDSASYAIREVAEIPYCTLSEANMILACLLSPNFSLLSHNKRLTLRVTELVHRYRLDGRFIPSDHFEVSGGDLIKGFAEPDLVLNPAREIAREAAQKGVCMFVVAHGIINMILAKHQVTHLEGIPVLEGSSALVKIAEMMVDLKKMGIEASRLGLYEPLPEGGLETLRKIYGPTLGLSSI